MLPHHLADLGDRVRVARRGLRVHERDEVGPGVLGERVAHLLGRHGGVEGDRQVVHRRPAVPQPVAEGLAVGARDDVQGHGAGSGGAADRALEGQQRLALHDHDVLRGVEQPGHAPLDGGEVLGAQGARSRKGWVTIVLSSLSSLTSPVIFVHEFVRRAAVPSVPTGLIGFRHE